MDVAKAAPNIPSIFYKIISNIMLTIAGIIMATIANLATLRPYNIVSHHTKCQERNGNNNGVKNSVAGFIMGPFAPKSVYQH
jgi:hypothetical protein